ncbi:molecular chaperone HscC-like protein, partial [Leptotrombidium deliense]
RKKVLDKINCDSPGVKISPNSKECITDENYESHCKHLFESIEQKLRELFVEVSVKRNQIKQVLLVGGSSKLKRLKRFINENFSNVKEFDDDAIAGGCALHSAIPRSDLFQVIRFTDVCSYKYATHCQSNTLITLNKRSQLPSNDNGEIKSFMDFAYEYPTFLLEFGDNTTSAIVQRTLKSAEPVRKNETAFKLYFEVNKNGIISLLKGTDDVKEEIYINACIRGAEFAALKEKAEENRIAILKDVLFAKERKQLSQCIEHNEKLLEKCVFQKAREKQKYQDHLDGARHVLNNNCSTLNELKKRKQHLQKQFASLS